MPRHYQRRIFRSGLSSSGRGRRGVSRTVLAGVLGVLGGAMVMIISIPSDLFGRVPVLAGMIDADSPQVAVVDGGTLRLRETVVRLQGINVPVRGQLCGGDPGRFDCGASAAQALAALVRGHTVTCKLAGRDTAGFPQARCESGGADLNRALVAGGWARAGSAEFLEIEAIARSQRIGIWRDGDAAAF